MMDNRFCARHENFKADKHYEPLPQKAGRLILSQGFDLVSPDTGQALHTVTTMSGFGIVLCPDGYKHIPGKPRRKVFVGTLHFNNTEMGAGEGVWTYEIHSSRYTERLEKLIETMRTNFGVTIKVCPSNK